MALRRSGHRSPGARIRSLYVPGDELIPAGTVGLFGHPSTFRLLEDAHSALPRTRVGVHPSGLQVMMFRLPDGAGDLVADFDGLVVLRPGDALPVPHAQGSLTTGPRRRTAGGHGPHRTGRVTSLAAIPPGGTSAAGWYGFCTGGSAGCRRGAVRYGLCPKAVPERCGCRRRPGPRTGSRPASAADALPVPRGGRADIGLAAEAEARPGALPEKVEHSGSRQPAGQRGRLVGQPRLPQAV